MCKTTLTHRGTAAAQPRQAAKDAKVERKGIGFWEGFGGTTEGSFFRAPLYVDLDKKPGYTAQPVPTPIGLRWFAELWNPVKYVWSVNLIWFACCVAIYVLHPYDFEDPRARELDASLVLERVAVHNAWCFGFFSAWSLSIYVFKMSQRRFSETEAGPSLSRFVHNLWYVFLGASQAGVWDALLIMLYANGTMKRLPDAEAFSMSTNGLVTLVGLLLGAAVRETHFFFCHLAIHLNYLYKHVHSLHHRNTVIEPFAGLTMHPIEHLYYYGCVPFSVLYCCYFETSAIVPLWSLVHALISPAASHSGVEDIWQSDQYHTLHHAKFECNYGPGSVGWDQLIGCYREKFGASECYKGAWEESEEPAADRDAEKKPLAKFLRGGLTITGALYDNADKALFDLLCCGFLPAFFYTAMTTSTRDAESLLNTAFPVEVAEGVSVTAAHFVGLVMGFFAPAVGLAMCLAEGKKSWRWPFHEWPVMSFVPLYVGQVVAAILPIVWMAATCTESMRQNALA
eukprot:TRINITY_DN1381_c0_g1_i2.p1 TRINITY_DN1381_c0_g1~~TRINITY_DN1381_c0_g1_i2.p1  ORF type:complete len:511 (+),score=232.11 TRINITY_DN1381_c0_g1_i2:57-1589(+)